MPTYQYACTDPECGNRFELVQTFTDPAASECPVCGSPVRKVFSAVGVVFKGSGFYRNDSRSGSGSSASRSESAKSGDSKSETTKSETKSETAKSSESKTSDTKSASSTSLKSTGSSGKAAASA